MARGCDEDVDEGIELDGVGIIRRCPLKLLTDITRSVMSIYYKCRQASEFGYQPNGILPYRGGIMDQPPTLLSAFDIIDNTVGKLLTLKRERERNRGR